MYPPTEDNFGIDSCALLVLPSNPITLVIAEPSGKLYHGIMLKTVGEQKERSFNELDTTLKIEPAEWDLFMLERVELDLGLPATNDAPFDYSSIFLKADINNESRYFAYHNAGLHAVSIKFIKELEVYFADNGNMTSHKSEHKFTNHMYFQLTKPIHLCNQPATWNILCAQKH